MLFNFFDFLHNNDLKDYMNCYSSFILTNKNLKNNVLNHRMNLLINYYVANNNNATKNKSDYIN